LAALQKMASANPSGFVAIASKLIPQQVALDMQASLPGNLSLEDWQVMREVVSAVSEALPDASNQPPGVVLAIYWDLGGLFASQGLCSTEAVSRRLPRLVSDATDHVADGTRRLWIEHPGRNARPRRLQREQELKSPFVFRSTPCISGASESDTSDITSAFSCD
jgi:hypothetical protein